MKILEEYLRVKITSFILNRLKKKGMFLALRYMNLKLKSNLDRKDRLESYSI